MIVMGTSSTGIPGAYCGSRSRAMIRLAHCADTHLDAEAKVNGKTVLGPDGKNIRSEDRIRCFRAAAEGAIERGCNLFLHAGDLFERNKPTPAEYCAAQEIFDLILEHMPVVACADNHGSVESTTERHAIEPLRGRHPNLHIVTRPLIVQIVRHETHLFGPGKRSLEVRDPVQVAVLPSPRRSIVAAKDEFKGLSPEGVNALISDKLRAIIRSFRARLDPALPAILMFHGRVQGAWLTDLQQATGGDQIALMPEDFEGFDYTALGDFHGYQQVGERAWYSGATDRTSFNEEHQAKGWICAELMEHTVGKTVVHEFVETPARRYVTYSSEELPENPCYYADVSEAPIYRVKGRVSQEEYDALAPVLAKWREIPTFSDQLEITRQTTARSEAMTADLSEEASLRLWHETNSRSEDLGELLVEHRRLAGAGK